MQVRLSNARKCRQIRLIALSICQAFLCYYPELVAIQPMVSNLRSVCDRTDYAMMWTRHYKLSFVLTMRSMSFTRSRYFRFGWYCSESTFFLYAWIRPVFHVTTNLPPVSFPTAFVVITSQRSSTLTLSWLWH